MSVRRLLTVVVTAVALLAPLATPSAAQAPPATEMGSSDWRQVSAGDNHTCGIRTTGRLYCWGLDDFGQLGNGPAGNQTTPQAVDGTTTWASVSAGGFHTCARRVSGRVFCWGRDTWGQLGDGGTAADATSPVEVSGGRTDWRTVEAGYSHTCAIRTSGRLYCWGYDGPGMLGNGATVTADQQAPVQVVGNLTDWTQVSAGGQSTCGRRANGRLYCWGDDGEGQLGDGVTRAAKPEPVPVGGQSDWVAVSVGGYHACGMRRPNLVFCWGKDDTGQLGNDATIHDHTTPRSVPAVDGNWRSVAAGGESTCGRTALGALWCWGRNDVGQVGPGTFGPVEPVPVEVAGGASDWTSVTVGGFHACALITSRRAFCFGANVNGQLGTLVTGGVQPWPVPVAA